jgi:hypothetical protein
MRVWLGGNQAYYIAAAEDEHFQGYYALQRAKREVLALFWPSTPARNSKRWLFCHSQG